MRVLHVIPSVAPRDGGPSAAIAPMCRALTAHGIDVLLASTDADGNERMDLSLAQRTMWNGVPAMFFKRDASESFKYSRGISRWLAEHVKEFDVVHVHALMSHASMAAASSARRFGVPYVVRPLGTLAPWSLGQNRFRKRVLLMLGAQQLLHDAGAVHCTSEQERKDLEETFGLNNGVVVPLGIDQAALEEEPIPVAERERDRYVLALSRIHPKKNLEGLIDAFLDVADSAERQDWRLVIAGSGDRTYQASLEAIVNRRNAERRVTFAGWVDGADKKELIRRASVFALASLHENFGMSVLEAQAAGIPVLVSEHVDLSSTIAEHHSGWVVAPSRNGLTDGLTRALSDASTRSEMGRAGRNLARAHVWPTIATRLVSLYSSVQATRPDSSSARVRMSDHSVSRH